jgi:hypothetical protein
LNSLSFAFFWLMMWVEAGLILQELAAEGGLNNPYCFIWT